MSLPLVIADTGVRANTSDVNDGVRGDLEKYPERKQLFAAMGLLVTRELKALETGDLEALGHLMHENQLLLEKLGVSSPEIARLVAAASDVGAMGAKLSG